MPLDFPADLTYITPAVLRLRAPGGRYDPAILRRWREQGRIEKLRNGLYRNTAVEVRGKVGIFAIANQVRSPSYVSLHSALNYWGLIPEVVPTVTSVTTRTTHETLYQNTRLIYHSMSPNLFFGYTKTDWKYEDYKIATPAKALLDLAYFNPDFEDPDWLYEMRFDEEILAEGVDWNEMNRYLQLADSPTLRRRIGALREFQLASV